MAQTNPFPHINLKLVKDAPPRKPDPFSRTDNPRTANNKQQRIQHSQSLNYAVNNLQEKWKQTNKQRLEDNLPDIPEVLSIFLRIDPTNSTLPLEDLRKFGIEVISELEDGFIIGASADITVSDLRAKIQKFANGKQNNVASLWEILQGTAWRPENILSPQLLEYWPQIQDDENFVIDVGIACLGMSHIPEHPKKKDYATEERYDRAVARWQEKREKAYTEWDDTSYERYETLVSFIEGYTGEMISSLIEGHHDSRSQLPDSFTCRVRISGKGLRDIVLNFPYLFDVSEAQDVGAPIHEDNSSNQSSDLETIHIGQPSDNAPYVCVIDSGIQERHLLLSPAIDRSLSRSWIGSPTDVSDYVAGGGHGTRVAGAILYPQSVPTSGKVDPICWIQNARVLDKHNGMPKALFPPKLLEEIIDHFYKGESKTRIYNHSITSQFPCRKIHMSAWSATMDQLSWENDILFIVSAGNLYKDRPTGSPIRLGIRDHLTQGRYYPMYLLEDSCRIADPAQSLQAVTVGSIGIDELEGAWNSFSKYSEPSSFSCTGLGMWGNIKPEVVEYGGDFATDLGYPPNLSVKSELSAELVRSTLQGGPAISRDAIGTSFSAPKVTHIVTAIERTFPLQSALLYRALLIQSARWPDWTGSWPNKLDVIRHIGYGIPDINRAIENTDHRITLITKGDLRIKAKQVHIFEVKIPEDLRRPGDEYDIRIDITLSYKAQPRRTRRNRQKYLSTWLEWQTSKINESIHSFEKSMIDQAAIDYPTNDDGQIEDTGVIQWAIRERTDWGEVRGVHRHSGTVQKDWTVIKSHEFREGFCIAIIGHMGWNIDPEASVPYALAVSFEAVNHDIEIYSRIAIENEIEEVIEVEY